MADMRMTGQILIDIATVVPEILALIPRGIATGAAAVAMLRALGLSDQEILAHIQESEAKLGPLVDRTKDFVVQRHPGDV